MKALVISSDAELKARIAKICAVHSPPIAIVPDMPGMVASLGNGSMPDIVMVDATDNEQVKLATLERLAMQFPQAALVLLATHQSPELLIAAMRAGVREVLALPLAHQDFEEALERITQKIAGNKPKDGQILAFLSCKGGSGATFVAANLGYALAALANRKVLLIDLNLQFGDAALYLSDARPTMTLPELCSQIQRLDAELLDASLVRVTPNFGVLPASDDPDPSSEVRPEDIEAILRLARKHYDFVILDIGRQINAVSIRALDGSDGIYPIVQQSLPYMRDGRRLLDVFTSLGYRKDKIHLVLNRSEHSAKLGAGEVERTLGIPIAHSIPNNFDVVSESINQGVPALQLARGSNVAKAFAEFVNQLTEAQAPAGRSMIRRLFVRSQFGQA